MANTQAASRVFAARLEHYMNEAGLGVTRLAEASGVSKGAISRYLSGDTEPGVTNILKLAVALGIAPGLLLSEDAPEQDDIAFMLTALDEEDRQDVREYTLFKMFRSGKRPSFSHADRVRVGQELATA